MQFLLYLRTSALADALYSPARLTPVVGVTPGTRYRTSIQELLHPRSYVRKMRNILQSARNFIRK